MFATAQRVSAGRVGGINSFLYWHGRDIARSNPVELLDAPPGDLQVRLLEVDPGGNPVRSFLDVVVPDQSTRAHLETVLAMAERMRQPEAFPVTLRVANAAIRLHLDTSLVPVWQEELADLTEHVRACVLSYPGLLVVPRYAGSPGELDDSEHALVAEAAARPDTEAVLELMRQMARARRVGALVEVVAEFATRRGDERLRAFLAEQVPGILANHFVPTFGSEAFERFVEQRLGRPDWGAPLREACVGGDAIRLAELANHLVLG